MVFAATYPHRVRKLVLLAPPINGLATNSLGPWWQSPGIGELWSFFCLNQEWYRHWLSQGWTSAEVSWQPLVEQYFRPLSTFAGRKGFLAVLRGSSGFDYAFYQERLKVPILVLRGQNDPFCPPASLARLLAALPQATLKILPQVGHFLPDEASQPTYESIETFLQGTAAEATVLAGPAMEAMPAALLATAAPAKKLPQSVDYKTAPGKVTLKRKLQLVPAVSRMVAPIRENDIPAPVSKAAQTPTVSGLTPAEETAPAITPAAPIATAAAVTPVPAPQP